MDIIQGLLLITVVHTLSVAAPGPDFILVTQQSLINGKRAGLMCSVGIALAIGVHVFYSALGLSALIASSANAMWLIKVLGGGYLIYLGFKSIRAKSQDIDAVIAQCESRKEESLSAKRSLLAGFLCNLLNPKAVIYFLALFTVVLSPDLPWLQLAIYGVWMMIIQFLWFALVTILLSQPLVNRRFQRISHWINRMLGGAMIALGVKVLATRTS